MSNKEKALSAFVANIAEINERLNELKGFAEEHLSYAPDDVTWASVSESEWYLSELTHLCDRAFGRGEYAKEE